MRNRVGYGLWVVLCAGCAASTQGHGTSYRAAAPPSAPHALRGSTHVVQRGETLWRIAYSFGLSVERLAAANRLDPSAPLKVGQRLFLPLPTESNRFLWPVRGTLRGGDSVHGIDLVAPKGSLVRASRSGRVVVAAGHLAGWGKTIVLEHPDGYLTIYAGLERCLVSPAALVRQGETIGHAGDGPLHFEIREGVRSKSSRDTLALLPGVE